MRYKLRSALTRVTEPPEVVPSSPDTLIGPPELSKVTLIGEPSTSKSHSRDALKSPTCKRRKVHRRSRRKVEVAGALSEGVASIYSIPEVIFIPAYLDKTREVILVKNDNNF